MIGFEHEAGAVAEFTKAAFSGKLLNVIFALAEGNLGFFKRVEHLGHHGHRLLGIFVV